MGLLKGAICTVLAKNIKHAALYYLFATGQKSHLNLLKSGFCV